MLVTLMQDCRPVNLTALPFFMTTTNQFDWPADFGPARFINFILHVVFWPHKLLLKDVSEVQSSLVHPSYCDYFVIVKQMSLRQRIRGASCATLGSSQYAAVAAAEAVGDTAYQGVLSPAHVDVRTEPLPPIQHGEARPEPTIKSIVGTLVIVT